MKKISLLVLILVAATIAVFIFLNKNRSPKPVEEGMTVVQVNEPEKPISNGENLPSFDIVRVEKDGVAVIAGRAIPLTSVDLMDVDTLLTTVTADENGEWVFLPEGPLASGTHELWLRTDASQTRAHSETVLVSVPEKPAETIVVLLTHQKDDIAILQSPAFDAAQNALTIASARYRNNTLRVDGKSDQNETVALYINNVRAAKTTVKENTYTFSVDAFMEEGNTYVLRVDRLNDAGKVSARAEVSFSTQKGLDTSVKIVKGDNLWNIARQIYGSGADYITIYRANKNQIKDPDLIYPEQVFVLPSKPEK